MAILQRSIPVRCQIMYMHVTIAVTPPWCNMEVANDFVHTNTALNATALIALRI